MSAAWYIFKRDERLGPMSSVEVRAALRDGTVDPMDLVSKVGSSVKIELYEVDEIFSDQDHEADIEVRETVESLPVRRASGERSSGENLKQTLKSQVFEKPAVHKPRVRNIDPKKFFLHDRKKRRLGPLSAKEIQSIFYRGIVDQSAKVVKAGTDKKVPVATFVAVYAGARARQFNKEQTQAGGFAEAVTRTAVAIPNSRVLDEMVMLRKGRNGSSPSSSLLLSIITILLGIAIGFWVIDKYIFVDDATPSKQQSTPVPERQEPIPLKNEPSRTLRQPIQRPLTQSTRPQTTTPARRSGPAAPSSRSSTPPRTINPRPQPNLPPPVTRRPTPPPLVQTRPQPPPRRVAPVVTPKPPVKAQPSSGGGSVAALRSQIGQVATANNMRFSKAAVQACTMRCSLTFTDSSGAGLTVVFFKGAFGAQLERANGSVTISGRISGTAANPMMILQSVR